MILEYPNYLDDATIDRLREKIIPHIEYDKIDCDNRMGLGVMITDNPELKEVDDELLEIFGKIQQELVSPEFLPNYVSGDSGYEYHVYKAGDFCKEHGDCELSVFDGKVSKLRYATVVIHLTTNEVGGETVFPKQEKTIKTEKGKVVIFPPYQFYRHYTNPSETPREIIMTWFTYPEFTVYKDHPKT